MHTSASLGLGENADPDVRQDLAAWADRAARDDDPAWTHTAEGPDDMPSHVKSAIFGPQLTLPVANGRLIVGTWQGVWLGKQRERGGPRRLNATLSGES